MNYSLLCKLLDGKVINNGKEKGPYVTDFLNNMTANYDLESIKENIESLKVENKLMFRVANNYKFIYAAFVVLFMAYTSYWNFITALFTVGIAGAGVAAMENSVDGLAGYSDETIRLMASYKDCVSKDEKAKENKK